MIRLEVLEHRYRPRHIHPGDAREEAMIPWLLLIGLGLVLILIGELT